MGGRLGLVLAAGAGRRMGVPKALVGAGNGEAWVARAARVLLEGGCDRVLVVLGAAADVAAAVLPADVSTTVADDWREGMSRSLAAGLRAAAADPARPDQVVVHLVDLPDVTAAVVRRVLDAAGGGPDALARAVHDGRPGHPAVIGRAHWDQVLAGLTGDHGAGRFLARSGALAVECADLADGRDADTPEARHAPPGRELT